MTAKAYLQRALWLKGQIEKLGENIFAIRQTMESVSGVRYDKINVQTSPEGDAILNYIVQLQRAEQKMVELQVRYYETYAEIEERIEMIQNSLHRQILTMRYLQGMNLLKIADKLGYSHLYVKNMHGQALREFSKLVEFC